MNAQLLSLVIEALAHFLDPILMPGSFECLTEALEGILPRRAYEPL